MLSGERRAALLGWLRARDAFAVEDDYDAEYRCQEKLVADQGTARIEQQAFAHFLERGELDRHLRRMRGLYRARRDALVQALAAELPEATVRGIAAGVHVAVELAGGDEQAIAEEASRRRIAFNTMRDYRGDGGPGPAVLMLGYGQLTEPAIRAGVRELADAVQAARA